MKKNIVIFFGGRSCEHEISIITARQVLDNIDRAKYRVLPVYINRQGVWNLVEFRALSDFAGGTVPEGREVFVKPGAPDLFMRGLFGYLKKARIDAAVLCAHGLNGEDGTLQGLLELSGVPYTSCGVAPSGVFMDKITAKALFKGLGLRTSPFMWFYTGEFLKSPESILDAAEHKIGYPCVVKPSNLGSSIGISVCRDRGQLRAAVQTAEAFDRRVLIERALEDFKEVNCAVLGLEDAVSVSECETPLSWNEFLTFDDKYVAGGAKNGIGGSRREFPADITERQRRYVRSAAVKVFRSSGCKGVVRADFLIDNATGAVYINEVNTVPGSLGYYFWEREGIPFRALADKLIGYAEKERRDKDALEYAYKTDVINAAAAGRSGEKAGGKVRDAGTGV